ncbi:MAG: UDP-N-acetylglucosamine 2-epimerase (non-hydrolyzing) [Planctomycetes bacterium]|nr:UDP-N-acetylglucosamine 2-epimerase (non-hydrolyzing) [Planctomycetota bacterium]MCB9868815.1 UDP-N-acetylglucosamine 2-epimerase (non-hydrolyzing) [Planctomycetota bacterium]
MRPLHVLLAIGTRPEAVKLAPVVHELRRRPDVTVRVLATAQHRQMLDQILAFFDVVADIDLDLMRRNQGLAELTSRMVAAVDAVLVDEQPDLVLAQGDTTTVMVTALCAFYRQIRFGHVEAGLRTGNKYSPFPEEMNRSLVARLADLHFAPTERSRANLLHEGIAPDRVSVTGNTVIDALQWAVERVDPAEFAPPEGRRLVLVTAHRREHFGTPFEQICDGVRTIADRGDTEVLYPVHPNPSISEVARARLADHPRIRLTEPLDYPRFVAAMRAAHLILTDSGGVQEEAPSLGKPILVLRDDTERPEGVDAGTARLVGPHAERIATQANRLLDDPDAYREMARAQNPYGDGHAARRIVDTCLDTGASP